MLNSVLADTWSGPPSVCKLHGLCCMQFSNMLHCKNTWVTLITFLGCLSCISVTKECDQGMLPRNATNEKLELH